MIFPIIFLLLTFSCTHRYPFGDKELSRAEAPGFLRDQVPEDSSISEVEFFRKVTPARTTFEIKYELDGRETSVSFSEDGRFLEREQDISFSSLRPELKRKIRAYLKKRFGKSRIHETELRTEETNRKLVDVEVLHGSGTGIVEISFTLDGLYAGEKTEEMDTPETLN